LFYWVFIGYPIIFGNARSLIEYQAERRPGKSAFSPSYGQSMNLQERWSRMRITRKKWWVHRKDNVSLRIKLLTGSVVEINFAAKI
jgi:hypothetical protein